MKVKTYGIYSLTEWHGKVKAGTIEVNVSFVGGTASPSGSQPAYMVTKDPITQFVIENSKEFKDGFIVLVMCEEIGGNHRRMAMPKPDVEKPKTADAPTTQQQDTDETETPAADATGTVDDTEGETSGTVADEDENPSYEGEGVEGGTDPAEGTVTEDGKRIVEVTDIDDARDYLVEEFQIARSTLRSNVSVYRAAEEHNIVFKGIE
jgi:hypothetical protein